MSGTYWNNNGEIHSYGSSDQSAQWNRVSIYSAPPASLEGNQPWLLFITHDTNMPYWKHITTGEVVWEMPYVFSNAMLLAGASSVHEYMPGGTYDEVIEQELIEYAMQLSLKDTHKSITTRKAGGVVHENREKNTLAIKQPAYGNTAHAHTTFGHHPVHELRAGKCTACFTDTLVNQTPCGCKYCPDCLAGIFIRALENEDFTQPLCCEHLIPIELVAPILERAGFGTHNAAKIMKPVKEKSRHEQHEHRQNGKGDKGKGKAIMVASGSSRGKLKVDCLICMETFNEDEVIKTKCQHFYCMDCMGRLFVGATKNEDLYPPKCCNQDIPIAVANVVLNSAQQTEFNAKGNEWGTKDRLYCSSRACSAFIPPAYIKVDIGTCNRCHERTCVHCKGPYHYGDCPKDKATQEFLKFAQNARWRKCYSCKRMVELDAGCNHITCLCGAEFCYECGAQWPTCNCKIWQQENLNNMILEQALQNEPQQYRRAERPGDFYWVPHLWPGYRGW